MDTTDKILSKLEALEQRLSNIEAMQAQLTLYSGQLCDQLADLKNLVAGTNQTGDRWLNSTEAAAEFKTAGVGYGVKNGRALCSYWVLSGKLPVDNYHVKELKGRYLFNIPPCLQLMQNSDRTKPLRGT